MRWQRFATRFRLSKLALGVAVLAGAKLALLLVMGFGTPSGSGGLAPQTGAGAKAPAFASGAPGAAGAQPGVIGSIGAIGTPSPSSSSQSASLSGPNLTTAQAVQAVRAVILDESLALAAQQAPAPAAAPDKKAQPAQPESVLSVQQLKARAEVLDRQEQALKAMETDLNARLAKLQALETLLQGMLAEAKTIKDGRMRHLIDVYTNMKPKQAASVLETLDENVAVKILSGMKGRQAGEVLTNVTAKKAAKLSEELTKLQVGPDLPEKP